jgi:hypothetical protein
MKQNCLCGRTNQLEKPEPVFDHGVNRALQCPGCRHVAERRRCERLPERSGAARYPKTTQAAYALDAACQKRTDRRTR